MKSIRLACLCFIVLFCSWRTLCAAEQPSLPNVVFILTDDQGYADVGCFNAKGFETPNWDRMAAEGMKFTSFYVGQAVCTASRAGLMTGCRSEERRVGKECRSRW